MLPQDSRQYTPASKPCVLSSHLDQVYCANIVEPYPKVYGAVSPTGRLHESGKSRTRKRGALASTPRDLVSNCVLTFPGCWAVEGEMLHQGTQNNPREKHGACVFTHLPPEVPTDTCKDKCNSCHVILLLSIPKPELHKAGQLRRVRLPHISTVCLKVHVCMIPDLILTSPTYCKLFKAGGMHPLLSCGGSVMSPLGPLQEGRFHLPTCQPQEDHLC